jgi:hypothetical protein
MTEKEIEAAKHLLKVVKLMLTFNITLYSIDEFQGTPFYRQELKKRINTAKDSLELQANDLIKTMFGADEDTIQAKLEEYERIAERIAKADFDDLTAISQGLDKYFQEKSVNK